MTRNVEGGCDCLIEEDVQELQGQEIQGQGKEMHIGNATVSIPDYVSLQQESTKKSPFETFNNDNDKSAESYKNLKEMIKLYTKTLKEVMNKNEGSREVLDDVYFLTLDHNENKMRSLFIKWRTEIQGLIQSLSSTQAKSALSSISSTMQNYSYRIMNQPIPDYKIYMKDVDIALNTFKKTIKSKTITSEKSVDEVKHAIDALLTQDPDKEILIKEFLDYDNKLFEPLDLHMRNEVIDSSEQMQGYKRFRQLRAQTIKNFMSALSIYEHEIRADIQSYKNHRPSEHEYEQLMGLYKQLNDTLMNNESETGPHSVQDLADIYKDPTTKNFYKIMYPDKDSVSEYQMIIVKSKGNDENQDKCVEFSRRNIDELYTRASASIVALMNNYEFTLRYCNALKQLNYQFRTANIQQVVADIIINYYLLLFFSPGNDCIFIRQLYYVGNNQKHIEDGNVHQLTDVPRSETEKNVIQTTKQIVPWTSLTKDNAEYKFYNVLSNLTYNCVKGLYGTFNLLIEYYLKPEKSLSQIISGAGKDDQDVKPITEAFAFYKLIKIAHDRFMEAFNTKLSQDRTDKPNPYTDIYSTIQFYTSSKFYELYMYFKHKESDLNKYISICNKLWQNYSDGSTGLISARCRKIIADYVKELLESLITQIYIGQTSEQGDLDQMSYVYDDIKKNENSLYTTAIYTDNNITREMEIPSMQPMKQKDDLIDSYLAINKVIKNFIDQQFIDNYDKDLVTMDKEYKTSIIQYFQDMLNKYEKVQRPEVKQMLFLKYMAEDMSSDVISHVTPQIRFIKEVGVALNQYTNFTGEAIKILVNYHKTHVELQNFPKALSKVLIYKLKVNEKNDSREYNVYKLFTEYMQYSRNSDIQKIYKEYNDMNARLSKDNVTNIQMSFDKIENDLVTGDVMYTFILQKLFQILEEPQNENEHIVEGLGAKMVEYKLMKPFNKGDQTTSTNLPFSLNGITAPPFFIMTEDIFHYLQTHQPYLKYSYYNKYTEYTQIVNTITQIPGIKIINGTMDTSQFFKFLEEKRQFVLSQFEQFKSLRYDEETYAYIKKHLEQGLSYGQFFKDVFDKYCPGPLDLNQYIAYNIKVYKFDDLDWWYYMKNLQQTDGKIKITYKEDQVDRDIMMNVYSPFKLGNKVYSDKANGLTFIRRKDNNNTNLQIEIIDELNFYMDKLSNTLKQQANVLPQDYIDVLTKNPIIQQSLITTPIEYNGSVFNLPLNTLQTPFRCPSILGVQDVEKLTEFASDNIYGNEIADRLKEEGCFFSTDTLELFMLLASGAKSRNELTTAKRNEYRREYFDKICKGDLSIGNFKKDPPYSTVFKQPMNANMTLFQQCFDKTLTYMTNPVMLQEMLIDCGINFYDFNTFQKITQYQQYNIQFVKVEENNKKLLQQQFNLITEQLPNYMDILTRIFQNIDNYVLGKATSEKLQNVYKLSLCSIAYTQFIKHYMTQRKSNLDEGQLKAQLFQSGMDSLKNLRDQTGVNIGDDQFKLKDTDNLDYINTRYRESIAQIVEKINGKKLTGDVIIGIRDLIFDELKNNIPNKTDIYIPLVITSTDGKITHNNKTTNITQATYDLVKSSKFAALSEALKKQYIKQINTISVKLIYNKDSKNIQVYNHTPLINYEDFDITGNSVYRDQTNPIIYMSNAIILQEGQQIEYSELQKYSILFDLLKLKRQLQQFSNKIQGLTLQQMQQIQSVIQTLQQAIDQQINKCKSILNKPGLNMNDINNPVWNQYMYDPVQFIYYIDDNDTILNDNDNDKDRNQYLYNFKKLFIQYLLKEKIDIGIKFEIIQNWFQINNMRSITMKADFTKFNSLFNMFQRAAFIKRRTPDKQIIGYDHYWVMNNNLIFQKNQPKYSKYGQNNKRGWFYDIQKQNANNPYNPFNIKEDTTKLGIYNNAMITISNPNLTNISDNIEYAELLGFNYAFVCKQTDYEQPQQKEAPQKSYDIYKKLFDTAAIWDDFKFKNDDDAKKTLNEILGTSNETVENKLKEILGIDVTLDTFRKGMVNVEQTIRLQNADIWNDDGTLKKSAQGTQNKDFVDNVYAVFNVAVPTAPDTNTRANTDISNIMKQYIDQVSATYVNDQKQFKKMLDQLNKQKYRYYAYKQSQDSFIKIRGQGKKDTKALEQIKQLYVDDSIWTQDGKIDIDNKLKNIGKILGYNDNVTQDDLKNNDILKGIASSQNDLEDFSTVTRNNTKLYFIKKYADIHNGKDADFEVQNLNKTDENKYPAQRQITNNISDIAKKLYDTAGIWTREQKLDINTKMNDIGKILYNDNNRTSTSEKEIESKLYDLFHYSDDITKFQKNMLLRYINTSNEQYSPNIQGDQNLILLSPLAIMQEITFFSGITDPTTLNLGRDIYALNSGDYTIQKYNTFTDDNQGYKYKDLVNITAFHDLYKLMIKSTKDIDGIIYNKDDRDLYLMDGDNVAKTAEFLYVYPNQFLYQVLTRDYRNIDGQVFNERRMINLLFQMMGIEPFNPIQLIKKNLPFPIMQAISIYIQVYEQRYLGPIERGFANSAGVNVIRLNQSYRGRPVYILCDNRNHPKIGTYNDANVFTANTDGDKYIIDTSEGQDVYYQITQALPADQNNEWYKKWTLQQIKNKEVQATKYFINDIVNDSDVYRGKDGYYLKHIAQGVDVQTTFENSTTEQVNMLQNLFTIIPRYFYQNSKLLMNPKRNTVNIYERQINGELIRKQQDTNTLGKKYLW